MKTVGVATAGEIEVWRIALDEVDLAAAAEILDRDELGRADRFAAAVLRRRFLARRVALRQILGGRLGVAPGRIALGSGAHGKPRVLDPPGPFFNLSHSGALALLAISGTGELGIDIEEVREVPRWPNIVREFFDESERRALLRPDQTARAFLAYWTRKEAVAKATGLALNLPLSSFSVADVVHRREGAISIPGVGGTWHVLDLVPGPEHIAALASSKAGAEISWKAFPDAEQRALAE